MTEEQERQEEQQETQEAFRDETGWHVLDDDGLPEYIDDDQVIFPVDPEQQQYAEYGRATAAELQRHQSEEAEKEALVDEIDRAIDLLEEREQRELSAKEIEAVTIAFRDGTDIELADLSDAGQRRAYLAERYQQPEGDDEEWS